MKKKMTIVSSTNTIPNCECHNKPMKQLWGGYYCVTTSNEQQKARNRAIVANEAQTRGGSCEYKGCSTSTGLEWHHRNPAEKTKTITRMISERSGVKVLKAELAKCDLLCDKHHKQTHREMRKADNDSR